MKEGIDVALQSKYRNTVNSVFGIDHKSQGYFISPSDDFVTDMATAFLLMNSAVLLTGPPGVGKTTLLRILTYHLTGNKDALALVNCTEDLRAEDFVYEVAIQYREYREKRKQEGLPDDESITLIEFKPKPRPMLTRTFSLINEVNRLSKRALNALLSVFAERSIVVHGEELRRETGIILMDMNPHVAGPLEWGFIDRVRANIQVPALDLGEQLQLLKLKYGKGKHIEDLVAYAMKNPAPMTAEELMRVWEDVDKVVIDDETFSSLVLFTNVFSSCKFDLSKKWVNFELPCSECQFKETCVTTQLEHPVFTRSLDHLVKMLKAEAYFAGRTRVDLAKDILPSLKRMMLHRLEVKPEHASRYVDAQSWYDTEIEQRILTLQENWKQSKAEYDTINTAIKEGNDDDAARIFNLFRKKKVKDPVSLRIVQMLEPTIEAAAEVRFKKAYAKCLAYEKAGYSKKELEEFAQTDELPPKFAEQLSKVRDKLLARLQGIIEIPEDKYSDFVVAMSRVSTDAADMVRTPSSWNKNHHKLSDGSNLEVSAERGRYIVTFDAETSQVADAIRQFYETLK